MWKAICLMLISPYLMAIETDVAPALLKDPMRPATQVTIVTKQADAITYQLSSIIRRQSKSVAIINGQRVGVGSVVDGARVLRIDPSRVLLQTGKQKNWISVADKSGMTIHRR